MRGKDKRIKKEKKPAYFYRLLKDTREERLRERREKKLAITSKILGHSL